MVLGRGAQQGDAADVDLLDGVGKRAAWACDGRGEGIEVTDDDGDRRDGLRREVLLIAGDVASEDSYGRSEGLGWMDGLRLTAVHNWMEGLYTATEHFGCFGDVSDIPMDRVGYQCHVVWRTLRTHSTVSPTSLIFFAVPPEASKRTPDWDSAVARSMRFALS